jgi:hypothetical protein
VKVFYDVAKAFRHFNEMPTIRPGALVERTLCTEHTCLASVPKTLHRMDRERHSHRAKLLYERDSKQVPVHRRFHIGVDGRVPSRGDVPSFNDADAGKFAAIVEPADS